MTAIDQTVTSEINDRHDEEELDSDKDEIEILSLSDDMKPIEIPYKHVQIRLTFRQKKMFSNCIAELMIAKNDEKEKDVMQYSLSEPLLNHCKV